MVLKFVSIPPSHLALTKCGCRAGSLFANGIAGLLLCPDKQHSFSAHRQIADEHIGVFEHSDGLLQVDDVDAVAFRKNIRRHFRVPTTGLVPEMDARFE
jgi:hypothetical protein